MSLGDNRSFGKKSPTNNDENNNNSKSPLGKNLNLPFDPKWGVDYKTPGDDEYVYAFERLVAPVLEDFQPELIYISCGFDSIKGDPLGKFSVSCEGYQYMTKRYFFQLRI